MKTTITVSVKGQKLFVTNQPVIAAGGVNETEMRFTFDETWDGHSKTAVFYRNPDEAYHCLLVDDACAIPSEVLTTQGDVYFGVFGKKDEITRTSLVIFFPVANGAFAEGITPGEPAPDIYAQLLSLTNDRLPADGVIVKSSTSGSTKRFKITVDDSGKISAVAVN